MESGASPLVGRHRELADSELALAAARERPPVVLELVGEPGIGKTRLLGELVARARDTGFQVHVGRGGELERSFPFGLVVDALDRPLATLEPARLNRLNADTREQLGAVFPALAHLGAPATGLTEERHRAHYAIRALLELLATQRPLVLALDDVHWADQASLELLAHLMRRPPHAPLALVLAYRPAQAPDRLAAALVDAERSGALRRIALGPLTPEESDALLGGRVEAHVRRALYRDSGGNPFYLEQLARAARRGPGTTDPSVPGVVLRTLADELSTLAPRVQVTARAAAVAGEAFEPDLVAAIADHGDVLTDLDALIACDLIRPAAPARFRFRHPIVRRAVYDSAPAAWLVGAHARAARTLERRSAPAVARAHHVERSAAPGDEAAIALLTEAANASLALAPATAARFYEAALQLLPDAPQRRLALLVPLATAHGTCGRLETSRDTMREILGLLPAGEPLHVRLVAMLAAIEHMLGRHDEADALLSATYERLPAGPSREAGALLIALASGSYFQSDWVQMGEQAERARGHATIIGEDGQVAEAASLLALAALARGDGHGARAEVSAAARVIDGLVDEQLAPNLYACFWASLGEVQLGRYADAIRHLQRGIELSRRTGQGWLLVQYHTVLSAAYTLHGRLDRAAEHAREAIDMARLVGEIHLLGWAQVAITWSALRAGQLGEAISAGEKLELQLTRWQTPAMTAGVVALAEARVETGAFEHGRDTLLEVYGGPELPDIEPAYRAWAYEILTRADLAAGRGAADWAARAGRAAAVMDLGRDRAAAFTAAGLVALARGDVAEATAAARAAARAGDESEEPIHAARARIVEGQALALAGDREGAVRVLDEAHRRLTACGAARYAGEAAALLRGLGRRLPHSGVRGAGDALSARERDVANLVAERLTNREIAARLFLSEKTVERHLSSIFAKLAVGSRVEVARAVERERAAV